MAQEWLKQGGAQGKLRHIAWIWNMDFAVYMWRYKQKRMYIPEKLRLEVLQKYHDLPWGGQWGQAQTCALIARMCIGMT